MYKSMQLPSKFVTNNGCVKSHETSVKALLYFAYSVPFPSVALPKWREGEREREEVRERERKSMRVVTAIEI